MIATKIISKIKDNSKQRQQLIKLIIIYIFLKNTKLHKIQHNQYYTQNILCFHQWMIVLHVKMNNDTNSLGTHLDEFQPMFSWSTMLKALRWQIKNLNLLLSHSWQLRAVLINSSNKSLSLHLEYTILVGSPKYPSSAVAHLPSGILK